jgi:DNA repair exonuclease SbcCD ATPase subunit
MHQLSDGVNRKFTDIINVDDYEIETDTGWVPITHLCKTIPYEVWQIETCDGSKLECADDHILFSANLEQIFAKNLQIGDLVYTKKGPSPITKVQKTTRVEQMFDVRVDHPNHRFWAGNFLSHNTTIINAICYALYNKPFDNISLQRLINSTNNTKNTLMEVRLIFEKGDDEFEIYRCRGETFNIQIMMNGEDVTLDSVAENDRFVEEIIGISYELFTKIIIFSGNSLPFLMMPVSQQRSQIEELFNITLLTEKAIKLKEIIKTTESGISIQEAVIKEQEAQVALYNKQLKDAESRVARWEDDRKLKLAQLQSQLTSGQDIDLDFERTLHDAYDVLKTEVTQVNHNIQTFTREVDTLKKDSLKLEGELKHLAEDKCPYCLQQYAGAATRLEEKKASLVYKQHKLNENQAALDGFRKRKEEIDAEMKEIESAMRFKTIAEAVKASTDAQTAQSKIDELTNAENPHVEALEQLKTQAVKKVSYEQLDVLKKDLEHQQFLLKLLTDKNSFIRRRIINKTIPFLNNRLYFYTKELGLPHIVKFDDDMSCTVSEYGRELDFGNLSSGEKKRVNLSLSLAFRDVLHHLHSRVNCLFIDEIDASLDGSGVENVFRLLKTKSRDDGLGMWIISHRPEAVGRFDRSLTVRKENGFSRIIDEHGEELETA